jgi:hypothetical protein
MSGILVVVHLVRCTQSLLYCDDIETTHLRFENMVACEAALPGLIEAETPRSADRPVVMGRCRFIVARSVPAQSGSTETASRPR